ncbi:MAG: zonular occludens toxin domain-containing protein [Lachnospiraceae bacterium]|nr:zonular occludens toxin domain-containing protein [Lachnospiraceae bacterium]
MIYFMTGKPGNGKSLHMAEIIYNNLRIGRNVIANFEINEPMVYKGSQKRVEKMGQFIYEPNSYWLNNAYKKANTHYSYLDGLYNYALQFHKRNARGQIKEHQTLLVLDECQELFNTRTWNRKDRLEWASFFRQHRKYGYDVYLISQDDKVIDKQIRAILEYELEHRCINNYKFFGKLLGLLCGGKLFVCIKKWYSQTGKAAHISSDFFAGRKKYYSMYDSYKTFARE